MDIASVGSSGLAATGSAITKAQQRFDAAAEQVVADTTGDGGDDASLVGDAVGLQTESIMNQVLFSVFARQSEQQKSLIDIINPS